MSTTAIYPRCNRCGLPIDGPSVWDGGLQFHIMCAPNPNLDAVAAQSPLAMRELAELRKLLQGFVDVFNGPLLWSNWPREVDGLLIRAHALLAQRKEPT